MKKYEVAVERRLKEAPSCLVSDGKANFGSYSSPIMDLNLLDIHHQSKWLPDFMNSKRLTEWEAFEISFDTGAIVLAVYKNMALNGMGILIYYDKKENKIYSYKKMGLAKMAHVAKNLCRSVSYVDEKGFKLSISNDCCSREAVIEASLYNKKYGELKLNISINEISVPSVVLIPLGRNKPLYSQKSFFKATGTMTFKNEERKISGAAIIDDHKGYYPYKSHYDWLTTMGTIVCDGKECYFGFNLTKNQSLDEDKYNENNIWLDSSFYYLPPVKFIKSKDKWLIRDEYGNVDLEFKLLNQYLMVNHLLVCDIKYALPFGYISGTLKGHDGKVFKIDNMLGIAEDKTTRL